MVFKYLFLLSVSLLYICCKLSCVTQAGKSKPTDDCLGFSRNLLGEYVLVLTYCTPGWELEHEQGMWEFSAAGWSCELEVGP